MAAGYALGVDLGTTSVKVALLNCSSKAVEQSFIQPSDASVHESPTSPGAQGADEQDVKRIVECLDYCMDQLDENKLKLVTRIGVCGQMHGCVLWKAGKDIRLEANQSGRDNQSEQVVGCTDGTPLFVSHGKLQFSGTVSNLYTWQDGRCSEEFLASLPVSAGPIPLSTGFGCATLAWLKAYRPEVLAMYDRAGTVMDFITCGLTGLYGPKMSTHNAVGWGYYDPHHMVWDKQIKCDWFPVHLLPDVVGPDVRVGVLQSPWHGIPKGVGVGVGLGDLQCSVLSAAIGQEERSAVLNVGTSSQLVTFKPNPSRQSLSKLPPSVMELPFFSGRNILVAASLNGGNVLSKLVSLLGRWSAEMGTQRVAIKDDLYRLLIEKAEEFETHRSGVHTLSIRPILFGERHTPALRATVEGIGPDVPGLGQVFSATCRGLVENLLTMMPRGLLQQCEVDRILGCGSALERNPVLQKHVKEVFSLPLLLTAADAAKGAALASLQQLPVTQHDTHQQTHVHIA